MQLSIQFKKGNSMKKIVLLSVALTCIYSFANKAQVWTQENTYYDMGFDVTAGISQENRIGVYEWPDGKKHIDEIHIAPSFDYAVCDWLSVGVNYRHVLIRDGSDTRYNTDHRPGMDVALKKSLYGFTLLNRSRFICRIPEGESAYFRYRNLSKVSYAIGTFSPYASYEWYYDEGSHDRPYRKNDRFSQQWISFGVDWKLTASIKASAYYMLTENKNRTTHDWYPGHVIGLAVSYSF